MARKISTRKTPARKTRGRRTSSISEREIFIGVIVLAVILAVIQGISDFFSRNPWVGWVIGLALLAIFVYAAIRIIKKFFD